MTKSSEEIVDQVAQFHDWYHQIELAPGVVTPGTNDSAADLQRLNDLGLPQDCTGMRVLDVGCRDGFYMFELERRGAQVIGVDTRPVLATGFPIASKILNSKTTFITGSIYDLTSRQYGAFDLVLYVAGLHRLRHPLAALECLWTLLKPTGLLFTVSRVVPPHQTPGLDKQRLAFYEANPVQDLWWVPNMPGLHSMLTTSGFSVLASRSFPQHTVLKARPRPDPILAQTLRRQQEAPAPHTLHSILRAASKRILPPSIYHPLRNAYRRLTRRGRTSPAPLPSAQEAQAALQAALPGQTRPASQRTSAAAGAESYEDKVKREGNHWSHNLLQVQGRERAQTPQPYLSHPTNKALYDSRRRINGMAWQEWVKAYFDSQGSPGGHAADLGCGSGLTGQRLLQLGAVSSLTGYDIADARLEEARKTAAEQHLNATYLHADANTIALEPGTCDLVFSSHSFHHFTNLEHIMAQCAAALTPRGLFILEEFVGPSMMQWTDEQMSVVADLLALMPEEYRTALDGISIRREHSRPDIAALQAQSPFEAIRSAEILPLFRRTFTVLHEIPLGSTIQRLLYANILQNFRPGDRRAEEMVKAVEHLEMFMIKRGALSSDVMLLVGKKKGAS